MIIRFIHNSNAITIGHKSERAMDEQMTKMTKKWPSAVEIQFQRSDFVLADRYLLAAYKIFSVLVFWGEICPLKQTLNPTDSFFLVLLDGWKKTNILVCE